MTMVNQDFSMYAGDSKNIIIALPNNINGVTVKWALKKSMNITQNEIYKTTDNGITVAENEITINLHPDDTLYLRGKYYHECKITDQLNNTSTITVGYVTIEKSSI